MISDIWFVEALNAPIKNDDSDLVIQAHGRDTLFVA
jgi:hypothetical protein